MASNKTFRFGPVFLSTVTTVNILNSGTGALSTPEVGYTHTQNYILLRHLRVVNKATGAVTFSLWLGATAGNVAGTEIVGSGYSVAANSAFDWYGQLRLDANDFLVGGASSGLSLILEGEGEIGVSG